MPGLRPCAWTALSCKDPAFQRFLGVDGEQAAAEAVRQRCEIESRAQLDRDAAARGRWNERIRKAYLQASSKTPSNTRRRNR